ncbi:MAG: oxygen-binding di-iron domain-containing protein [Myxococcaceae bacterium]
MEKPYEIQSDIHVFPAYVPVPAIGLLPVNGFLVRAAQPYLVDTGLPMDAEAYVHAVEDVIDPTDLKWIYLTHTDPDHIGALVALLDRAPGAKIITTLVAFAKLQIGLRPLPPDRVVLLNPGERLNLGDRALSVMRPPLFDAPETTMVHDSRLDALFSADAFGGPLDEPAALANELPDARLEPSQLLWASVDAPWIHYVDRRRFGAYLAEIQELDPAWVFSSHLPPARRMAKTLCRTLYKAPDAAPWVAPDQAAFQALMRDFATTASMAP